jgi:hypothetical protein
VADAAGAEIEAENESEHSEKDVDHIKHENDADQ